MDHAWREVGENVFVRRHDSPGYADLNAGLVVGDGGCLVIDTCSSQRQGRELAEAIRHLTPHPCQVVVNTHAHYDHFFGNAEFRPALLWGHRRCAATIAEYGPAQRRIQAELARAQGRPDLAADLAAVELVTPDHVFAESAEVRAGGRTVRLRYLGRGHTDNDIVVEVPDAGVVFAGDLVEQGAPPAFEDAFPLDWPATVDALLALLPGGSASVVPGHGDVVDHDFVHRQAGELRQVAELARVAYADRRDDAEAWRALPLPEHAARPALARAFRQLDNAPPYDPPEALQAKLEAFLAQLPSTGTGRAGSAG